MSKYINIICHFCGKTFEKELKYYKNGKKYCCSRKCVYSSLNKSEEYFCKNCNKKVVRQRSQKQKNVFCSKSCSAIYNNAHKTHGVRRSKLEVYLEKKLNEIYGKEFLLYNNKEIINSELDIYVPSLKLAFELNGIFHYEPIYGEDKLHQIQNNDDRKFQACIEKKIGLCIIDSTKLKYFKESKAEEYLIIIKNIIDDRLKMAPDLGFEPK